MNQHSEGLHARNPSELSKFDAHRFRRLAEGKVNAAVAAATDSDELSRRARGHIVVTNA